MSRRGGVVLLAVLLVGLGAMAWWQRDAAWLQRLAGNAGLSGAAWQDDRAGAAAGAAGVHKCRQGHELLYVNGPCPPGSLPLTMDAGAVTLVPGHKAPLLPALPEAGASRATLRDLLGPAGPDLKEQMMERAIEGR
jgi:hypothetical protein